MIQAFDHNTSTAKSRYAKMEAIRKTYTTRAEECAKYTIPMEFPKESNSYTTNYETPYQSLGARGVNNLTSKLMLALFPPNSPFFRLTLGEEVKQALGDDPATKRQWEEALSMIERKMQSYMENHQVRTSMYEAFNQLLIPGNVLLFLPPAEGGVRIYKLNSYCVSRDGVGNVMEIVTKESIAYGALSEEAQRCIQADNVAFDKNYEVYTHTYLEGDIFKSYQEIEGQIIPGSEQEYPRDKSPWIPLRLKKMDGEDYGRSFIEDYIGDLKVLEALSKSTTQVAAIASNILFLVNPNAVTRISELQKASSGDFIKGRLEDVQVLQINKTNDLQITSNEKADITSRLSYAFLLNSAVQRNGDRVTAEEIRYVARELEDTVGSIYSILAQELQLPLVKRVMIQMMRQGHLPDLPEGAKGIEPMIVTGIEALGRGHDLNNLDTFIRYAQVFPEAFQTSVKQAEILRQIATSLGIDSASVIKTDEEIQQEQQQAMQMQMAQQMAPQVARGAMEQQEE